MKEFESIRSDLDVRNRTLAEGASGQGQGRRRAPAGAGTGGKGANPDLLELRPWDADGEDLFEWYAVIKGPDGGSYEGESRGVAPGLFRIPLCYCTDG